MTHFTQREKKFRLIVGESVHDYDSYALSFLANDAPILNPLRPFCPLGKLSWAATKAREAGQ